jgi:hypothetical protein
MEKANAGVDLSGAARLEAKSLQGLRYTESRSKKQASRRSDPVFRRNSFARSLTKKEFDDASRRHRGGR